MPKFWVSAPKFRVGAPKLRVGAPKFRVGAPKFKVGASKFGIGSQIWVFGILLDFLILPLLIPAGATRAHRVPAPAGLGGEREELLLGQQQRPASLLILLKREG